jgi:hypothetical protein
MEAFDIVTLKKVVATGDIPANEPSIFRTKT